jgi:Na(+)-translocating NADH:ubiquinone oxidoreductase A subunit
MRFTGGYNIRLEGKPSFEIGSLPDTDTLHLPLSSARFNFSRLCVEDGRQVEPGDVLAEDPANHSVPLLAPMAGTVRLSAEEGELTLENVRKSPCHQVSPGETPQAAKALGAKGDRLWKLLRLGAWQHVCEALTGDLPDPFVPPQTVIVSNFRMDSFVPATEVLLRDRLDSFAQGLEHVRGVAGDCPLYLIMPDAKCDLTSQLKEMIADRPWMKILEVPLKYPFGNLKLNAQRLELDSDNGPVWGLGVEGVLAAGRVLSESKPCVSRIISIGGPAARNPVHVETVTGYPVEKIRGSFAPEESPTRVINGGVLAGKTIPEEQRGLDAECLALTLIPENTEREVLAFADLGLNKHAFTRTFFGILRPPFRESYTTAIRGEHRPCVSCSCCQQACPAGIMPFLVHRYVDKNRLVEAQRFGLDLCVECGLCSHVCLAKREMSQAFYEAHEAIRKEAQVEEGQS